MLNCAIYKHTQSIVDSVDKYYFLSSKNSTHMYIINSVFLVTADATPPIINHGFNTVWPPLQLVPASTHWSAGTHIHVCTCVLYTWCIYSVK